MEIRSACWQQGLQTPTRRTVQRRLDAMDAREVAKAREGAKAARQKFALVTGENKANQPLEIVQRECHEVCVSGLAHAGFRYCHALKRSSNMIAN